MGSLIIAALIGAAASLSLGIVGSVINYNQQIKANEANLEAVKETNETNAANVESTNEANLQIARENNATQMDLAKNGISYRMNDLQNAGLNPVLAAGGMSAPSATLSTPHMQAAQAQAGQVQPNIIDFNGIGNAITAMNNAMLTQYLMEGKKDIAAGYQATSSANNEARNEVLRNLYKNKAAYFKGASGSNAYVGNAKQIDNVISKKHAKEWDNMLKELDKIAPKKF